MPVAPDTLSPLLGNLLETATLTEELRVLVSTEYDTISQSDMLWLKQRSADEVDVRNILAAIEVETTNRMDNAKKRLEKLLEAGEIQKLSRQITKLVNDGHVDAAFMTVLNQNVQAAAGMAQEEQDEGPNRYNILNHVATCVQEELEKRTAPEVALLHKLMRTDDPGLRGRILRHYLAPQREILLPDTTSIPLDTPKEARVPPMKFSEAVLNLVTTLRSLDVDGDMVVNTIDEVRQVAKEARLVIQEDSLYDDELLEGFSLSLIPAFGGSES